MSRRKRASAGRRGPAPAAPSRPAAGERTPPKPNPPRPHKPLLIATGILVVVWITFLVVLAVTTQAP